METKPTAKLNEVLRGALADAVREVIREENPKPYNPGFFGAIFAFILALSISTYPAWLMSMIWRDYIVTRTGWPVFGLATIWFFRIFLTYVTGNRSVADVHRSRGSFWLSVTLKPFFFWSMVYGGCALMNRAFVYYGF